MSTTELKKEKVVIGYADVPILADLEFQDLVREYRKLHLKEADANAETAKLTAKKKAIGVDIQAAIETVQADSISNVAVRLGNVVSEFKVTLVKGEPGSKTDEDKLKLNLMKMAKLDVAAIDKIFAASQVPVAARAPYVLVTVQE
mgnify:CR=1 FL=1